MNSRIIISRAILFFVVLLSFSEGSQAADQSVWKKLDEATLRGRTAERLIVPERYVVFALNKADFLDRIKLAPMENAARDVVVVFALPMPDGTVKNFRIEESPVMESGLAAQFPEIRTYRGYEIDHPDTTTRFDWTPLGFHAIVLSTKGTIYIDPYGRGDTDHYISYYKSDYKSAKQFRCSVTGDHIRDLNAPQAPRVAIPLRTFRLALAATGEYTQFYGGTVGAALAGMTTSVNRVNAVYEREVAVHLNLVANETSIIYTNPSTDPYKNDDGPTMLGQNQNTLDNVIGNANYDIGHVFSTGGGGIAGLGVVCQSFAKAEGVTGQPAPIGDPFDVDYVAHEMGHQFGGSHTFNGTTNKCNGNRDSFNAYEPGSGSTIMAYAGICGVEDLQPHSDAYFHVDNLDEINAYLAFISTCPTLGSAVNNPPVVNAGSNFTIPRSTPFQLQASATDPDGDTTRLIWEEFDLGAASPPSTDDGSRPLFRSFPSADPIQCTSGAGMTCTGTRVYPKQSDLLSGVIAFGEVLPTTTRTLKFRVTARDDNPAVAGGVGNAQMQLNVVSTAGPFVVTQPDSSAIWTGGSTQTVTWNVANTGISPVSAANVKITLSTTGGTDANNLYPLVLAASTPNDGSEQVLIPDISTTQARIKVEAVGNVFFNINSGSFVINSSTCPAISISPGSLPNAQAGVSYNESISANGGTPGYTFAINSGQLPAGLALGTGGTLSGTPTAAGDFNFTVSATDANGCAAVKSYTLQVDCLFCDDFEDGNLTVPLWTIDKGTWTVVNGDAVGTVTKKGDLISPDFGHCSQCTFETNLKVQSGGQISLFAWNLDGSHNVEVRLDQNSQRLYVKQKFGGASKKAKVSMAILADTYYNVKAVYNGSSIQILIDGALKVTLTPAGAPDGNAKFRVKSRGGTISANIKDISVY